jgi:hypothetical protein
MSFFEKASASVKRLNPHLFAVGGVEAAQPQPASAPPLARGVGQQQGGAGGICVRVGFIACLRRQLDDDNLVGSLKPLRDAVAKTLGLDDADRRIHWQCEQVPTKGREGVIVKVELL